MRDLGTHYEFLADVTAEIVLNDTPSMTYTYYQSKIKPNANISEKKLCTYAQCVDMSMKVMNYLRTTFVHYVYMMHHILLKKRFQNKKLNC